MLHNHECKVSLANHNYTLNGVQYKIYIYTKIQKKTHTHTHTHIVLNENNEKAMHDSMKQDTK